MRKLILIFKWAVAVSLIMSTANAMAADMTKAPLIQPPLLPLPLPKGIMKLDGQPALPLLLNDLDGEPWDISESRGHWVFLHFWASWCGPCRREMPTIQAILSKFEKNHLEIVLINTAESEDLVFEFLGAVAPDLNSLVDADGQVTERWQPRGLPATFFVDPSGKLQYLALGGRAWNEAIYTNFLMSLSQGSSNAR